MKLSTAIILVSIWFLRVKITNANYRRIIRGPPQPPRPPPGPIQHSLKKWSMGAQRPHIPRPLRPIPVHVQPNFKGPIGPPLATRHPIPLRKQNIWKTAQILKLSTEKPFLSSPTITIPEYEYHIQTNSIPHPNTIQQNDEKGPIHTIPAPNLSLADKPSNIEQVQSIQDLIPERQHQIQQQQIQQQQIQQQQQQQIQQQQIQQQFQQQLQQKLRQQQQQQRLQNTVVEIQKSHQYEVTESPNKLPVYFAPDLNPGQSIRNTDLTDQLNNQPHAEFLLAPPDQLSGNQLSPQELYKFFNGYPQQQLVDGYSLSTVQQPQLQQHIHHQKLPGYQAVITNPHLLQQNQFSKNKLPVQPHYQPFNYNEQEQRNLVNNQISSRVTADYSVKPYDGENTVEALAQAQYVQHFFDTRDDNLAGNNVEQGSDLKESDSNYFSTLPNKEAAETLASLQEAGELNNKMNVEMSKQIPISIYVPDTYDDNSEENEGIDKEEFDKKEYDDVSLEESNDGKGYGRSTLYGTRLRNKASYST